MKTVGYLCEPCEFITVELIQKIEEYRKEYQVIGIAIHSDKLFFELNGRKPIKSYEDRAQLAKAFRGVDFVFELNSESDINCQLALNYDGLSSTTVDLEKPHHIIYAPGTYDLFHEGHMAHLNEVKTLCDILVVGVNSDELVYLNKGKIPKLDENARLSIISNLEIIDYSFILTSNLKSLANKWCKENIGEPIDAIFLGSDLRGQDLSNDTNIPVFFTERDPYLMERRSSTYYRQVLSELQKEN